MTPPSRTIALESAGAPDVGHDDVQIGVSRIGTIWGPELVAGDTRVRRAVTPGVVVEGEAGIMHLLNEGGGDNRNAITGRVGVLLRPPEYATQELRVALLLGLGGGHAPAAGNWGTFDIGAVLSGSHRWIRPLVGASAGMSRPFSDTTFMVTEANGDTTTLQLPRNLTAQFTAGLELGHQDKALVLGATMTHFWLAEPRILAPEPDSIEDRDVFFALGAAARFALD